MRRVRPSPTTAALAVRLLRDWSAIQTPMARTPARSASARSRAPSVASASGVRRKNIGRIQIGTTAVIAIENANATADAASHQSGVTRRSA